MKSTPQPTVPQPEYTPARQATDGSGWDRYDYKACALYSVLGLPNWDGVGESQPIGHTEDL